ncbi:MAG: acyloxyacyl hydrolase [Armatimonadetes bacterium]|nr:acyloxyacyl hydrolase [Armatimonadota bacterium]
MATTLSAAGGVLRYDSFERGDREVSLQIGYGASHHFPSACKDSFQFDAVKLRYGVFTSPRTQLALDVSRGINQSNQENKSVWGTVSYRRYFMVRGSTALGYDLNMGMLRYEKGVKSLGTRINFTEQIGLVFQHGITENSAISLDYKFSHVSNAGVRLPNIGINTSMMSVGYSRYY